MLSIIIPTKNEAQNLEILFSRINKIKNKIGNYEIIIADSYSKDKTIETAEKLASKKNYCIKAIQTGNTDLSNAIAAVLNRTKGDIIAVMDGDLQHPPELLEKMLATLRKEDADLVIASRFVPEAKINFSKKRLIVAKIFRFLTHLFVPKSKKIKDPSSGFFMFKKEIIKNSKLKPLGFKILLEIIAKCRYNKVIEIPFSFDERKKGKSKFSFKQTKISFKHLLKLAKHSKEHIRFAKFCAVGASGIIVNEGFLFIFTEYAKIFYLISSLIAIELSIISNFILNDIWTFRKDRKGTFLSRLLKFNFTRFIALIINIGILWLLTVLGMHYMLSNLIGIAIATLITYFTSLWWVWK